MAPRTVPEWTIVDFIHRGPWWTNRGILILNIMLILPLLTSVTNGLDSSLVNGLQILPDWQSFFGYPEGSDLGLIGFAQNLGCILGLPFTPFVSDHFGRRATLFVGSIIMLAGVGVQTAAFSVAIFIAARITIGVGLTMCMNAAPLLLLELSYPTHRGKITSIYNSSWYVGSIISAWVCFGAYLHERGSVWSWRAPSLVQALVPLLQVTLIWFVPESPRYLVSKGMEGRASVILAKYHANGNDVRDPLVVFEIAQIRHALRMEEEINKSTSYLSLFATPGNRKRMRIIIAIAMFSQWSGNGLVSYYINLVLEGVGVTRTETKAAINGGLQIFNFLVAVSAAMLVDWVGRRALFIVSNTGMLITFSAWTISVALYNTMHNAAAARATVPLIFLFYFFYDIAYTPMLVAYTLEILPYKVRAKGFALMNLAVMLTSAFNQFINPWAIDAIGWWYYIAYCAWLVIELIFVIVYVVETKGRTLEETAALFDGDEQQHDLMAMGGEAATMTMSRGVVGVHQGEDSEPKQERIPTKEYPEYYELQNRQQRFSDDGDSAIIKSRF
ncbi:Lactose permease [Leucoagaricus sp. SymC.cos]|nr:Lactose permease [Leucoagaricus sp. SymC.cos]